MLLRLLCISLLPVLIAGQEFQCGTDKIQSDIAKTVVQFNCKDKVADINKCCINHDGCYDQQQPRSACDLTFCTCVQAASAGNPLCGFYTSLFCDTAKVFGEGAYKKVGEEARRRREKREEEDKAAAAAAAAAAMNLEERLRKEAAAAAAKNKKAAAKAATTLVASAPEPAAAAAVESTTAAPSTTTKKPEGVKLTITRREDKKEEVKVPEHEPKEPATTTTTVVPSSNLPEPEPKVPEPMVQEPTKEPMKEKAGDSRHKEEKLPGDKTQKRTTTTTAAPEKELTSSEEDAELADLEARLAREEADLERAEAEQRRVLAALAARKAALRAELQRFREAQRRLWRAKEEAAASSDAEEETTASAVEAPATTTTVASTTTTIDPVLQARTAPKRLEMRARHEFMKKKAEERKARASKTHKIEPTPIPVKSAEEPKVTVTTAEAVEGSGQQAGEAKGNGTSSASATETNAAPTPQPAATPSPYAPVQSGQSAPEVVAAAEAAAAAAAAKYRAAQKVTPSPLQFTPFPDPMERLRDWMAPRTRGTPAPVTPDPAEIERQRVQGLARAAFERSITESRRANAELRLRDHQLEEIAAAKMRAMAERKHAHPTATPPPAYGEASDGGAAAALHEFQRSLKGEQRSVTSQGQLALSPEQEARIAEQMVQAMRKSFAKPELKKIDPGREDAFSQDDDDGVQGKEQRIEERDGPSNIRRSPTTSSTLSPSTSAQPSLVAPPTTFNNLFHNVPPNSEPQPFAEVKATLETTVATVFHQKHSTTVAAEALPEDDPSASVFHRKDPLPITQFLQDREAIDTLSSIDVGVARGEEEEETSVQHLKEGFTPVAEEAGPFESLLQEAQEHLRQSQQRVDQLIKDQRLKIEREEKERKRLLEERRLKLAEQRRLLEERKKRREEKRKERLARQRLLAERANESEWSRRLDQEAKVKALEDSTRVPDNSLEDDAPTTTTKKRHHKKYRTTTTVEPEDEEESSDETTTAKSRRTHSRHAKNELDSDSYEAYEQWLRWREKRKLARRKHATESETDE